MNKQNQDMSNEQIYETFRSHGYNVAANYRQRARKIIEQFIWCIEAFVRPERRKEFTQETMDEFIDELPGILNYYLEDTGRVYSSLPLTEEQMSEIEQNMASQKFTIIKTDDYTFVSLEPIDNKTSSKGGS